MERGQLQKEVIASSEARRIVESPVFKNAVAEIEQALLDGIKKSGFADEKLREKLCAYYTLLHKLIDTLKSTMDTGKLAQKQLEIEEEQKSYIQKIRSAIGGM